VEVKADGALESDVGAKTGGTPRLADTAGAGEVEAIGVGPGRGKVAWHYAAGGWADFFGVGPARDDGEEEVSGMGYNLKPRSYLCLVGAPRGWL